MPKLEEHKFKHLFTPIKINNLMIKNRIVAAPTGDLFEEKANGGAGIVICGHTIVDPGRSSFASGDEKYVFDKYEVEKTREKVRKIHKAGAKASIEIFHAGEYARVLEGVNPIGPVEKTRFDGLKVKAMDQAMMNEVADMFAKAAKDAKDFGFDLIFLHFGHGWLPAQFLSPYFNKRTDEYGGSIENRIKFPKLILERIRSAVGPHYPVDMRISAIEWVENSIEFKDTLYFIKAVEHLIDTVQISAGMDIETESNIHMVTTNLKGHMVNADFAKEVKENVSIPVSTVGAVLNPYQAEFLIKNNYVDLVAFGRSFIADPDWPNKAKDGREKEIMPCIRCMQCYHIATNRRNVGCSVNPRFTNETFLPKELTKTKNPAKIGIVGGGIAGMKCAMTLANRGHHVVLYEKTDKLGGNLNLIKDEKFKVDIKHYFEQILHKMSLSNVEVKYNFNFTKEDIINEGLEKLVIAVGAKPINPRIPGVDRENVFTYEEALLDSSKLGQSITVVGGGVIGVEIGLELAVFENKNVTVVEMSEEILSTANMLYKTALLQKIRETENITILTNSQCQEINEVSVTVNNEEIETDSTIISVGLVADRQFVDSLYGVLVDTYEIGDCRSVGTIMSAVYDGYSLGSHI